MSNNIEVLERYSISQLKELTDQYLELCNLNLIKDLEDYNKNLEKIKHNIRDVGLGLSAEEILNEL